MARVIKYFKSIPSRIAEYFTVLGYDYKSAIIDALKDAKEKPLKAGAIAAILASFTYAYKTNPTERDMFNELAEKRQLLVMLPNSIHNPVADQALSSRTNFLNQNSMQFIDCFFFSLLIKTPNDKKIRIYESQDKNLKDWWFNELRNNFVDIGVFGKWYRLNDSFIDYDVNKEELQDLPGNENLK